MFLFIFPPVGGGFSPAFVVFDGHGQNAHGLNTHGLKAMLQVVRWISSMA
ncbi:MAG: hypothetical protein ABJV04_02745 [Aliiglaciecola sp.]